MSIDEKKTSVRAAVVQAGALPFDTEACVDKAIRLMAEASGLGAKVIVFPEAFIPGYPKGVNYGLVVGARDPAGREEFRLYLEAAIEVPGPQTRRLGEVAAAHGAYVVIGAIERENGTCYCTVLFFGPDGSLLGKHRKLMPTVMALSAASIMCWSRTRSSSRILHPRRAHHFIAEIAGKVLGGT